MNKQELSKYMKEMRSKRKDYSTAGFSDKKKASEAGKIGARKRWDAKNTNKTSGQVL